MDTLNELLNNLIEEQSLIFAVFGSVRKKSQDCRKITLRPILLHGVIRYQAEYHIGKKVLHENMEADALSAFFLNQLTDHFKQANLFSHGADYQVLAAKPESLRIIKGAPTKQPISFEHNQTKQYILPDKTPCDFLIHLGVMKKDGQVIAKHYAKFRQINRFLELIEDVLPHLETNSPKEEPLRIVDFGCGKAYLTFALYHYLHNTLRKDVEIIGLDLKEEVINFCNDVASELGYNRLKFQVGDIAEYDGAQRADMVVTLHACDTATDFALMKAVHWQATVILSVPCCQHELFSQIQNSINAPFLKHGLLKERFAALLTDGLRALKLEEYGYHVDLVEFTSLEHTSKNIMLRAVKTGVKKPKAAKEFQTLLQEWHVNPTIGQLEE